MAATLLMVHGTAWCTAHLRAHRRIGLEALLYSGPGIGIVASGTLVAALHGTALDSSRWWLAFGAALALLLALNRVRSGAAARTRALPRAPRHALGRLAHGRHEAAKRNAGDADQADATMLADEQAAGQRRA